MRRPPHLLLLLLPHAPPPPPCATVTVGSSSRCPTSGAPGRSGLLQGRSRPSKGSPRGLLQALNKKKSYRIFTGSKWLGVEPQGVELQRQIAASNARREPVGGLRAAAGAAICSSRSSNASSRKSSSRLEQPEAIHGSPGAPGKGVSSRPVPGGNDPRPGHRARRASAGGRPRWGGGGVPGLPEVKATSAPRLGDGVRQRRLLARRGG